MTDVTNNLMNSTTIAAANGAAGGGTPPPAADIVNLADEPKIPIIPDRTPVNLQMIIKPGNDSPDGMFTKFGDTAGLDVQFKVLDGPYANRKIFQRLVLKGNNAETRIRASMRLLRSVKESVFNVAPDPTKTNPVWRELMALKKGYQEFHGLCFAAQVSVMPESKDGRFEARNIIHSAITPGTSGYYPVPQAPVPPMEHSYATQYAAMQGAPPQAALAPQAGQPMPQAVQGPATPTMPAPAVAGVSKPTWAT